MGNEEYDAGGVIQDDLTIVVKKQPCGNEGDGGDGEVNINDGIVHLGSIINFSLDDTFDAASRAHKARKTMEVSISV